MSLEEYQRKRRFAATPEPRGRVERSGKRLRFVVQEHHATRRHWDFRLEMGGTLKSWAVPKGPSYDPDDKRLAVPVEDHPIDYMEFEGVIPEGNYGAGTVMVWDLGTYTVLEGDPEQAYANGKLTLILSGRKLRGEFHLVRTKMGGQTQWLMFKKRDDQAVPGWALPEPSVSVQSGRTIAQIAADTTAQWKSGSVEEHRRAVAQSRDPTGPLTPTRSPKGRGKTDGIPQHARKILKSLKLDKPGRDPYPRDIRPMLATLADEPFDRPGWMYEIKWDGVRAIAYLRRRGAQTEVTLRSRGGMTLNRQFPETVEALYNLGLPDAVFDGEIVALDAEGRAHFQLLQPRIQGTAPPGGPTIVYYIFDIPYFNGHSLLDRPLEQRRKVLEAVIAPHRAVRTSDAVHAGGVAFYRAAQTHGIEGIVAKQVTSRYEAGVRSRAWLKIKVKQRLEAVVGGFTRGQGARTKTFGALLLGAYAGDRLVYIGHCGSGFTDDELRRLIAVLQARADTTCPFGMVPPANEPATWVRPELVVEVEHGGWTNDGLLRAPVYVGTRTDKAARDVVLERPEKRVEPTAVGSGESGVDSVGGSVTDAQLPAPGSRSSVRTRTRKETEPQVEFTNLDKIFWPQPGYTKGDLIKYYLDVGPVILPHLRDRPVTLRRFPNGVTGESFYQKDYPDAPAFVRLVRIWTESEKKTLTAPVCSNLPTLLWLGQLADIEIHTWFSRIAPLRRSERAGRAGTDFAASETALHASVLNRPDYVVFDIDPYIFPDNRLPDRKGEKDPDYSRRGFEAARSAALLLREVLKRLRLDAFVKTSGKTGLHLFVPIARRYTFEQTHAFAKTVTQYLEARHPQLVTTEWTAQRRVGKVFLDYNQNRRGATLASAYSARPTPEATVSVPLSWKELERGLDPLEFTIKTVPSLMKKRKDPWANLLEKPQLLEGHL